MQLVHISTLRKMLRAGGEMNLKFWDTNGNIIVAKQVVVTSSRYRPETVNIKFIVSGAIRKVHVVTIFEINDMEVYI